MIGLGSDNYDLGARNIIFGTPKIAQHSQNDPFWAFLGDQKSDFQPLCSVRWISDLFLALKKCAKATENAEIPNPNMTVFWSHKNINVLFLPKCIHSISNYLPHLEHLRVIALSIFRIQKLPLAANRLKNQMLQ